MDMPPASTSAAEEAKRVKEIHEVTVALQMAEERLASLAEVLAVAQKEDRLRQLEARMGEANFWANPQEARQTVAEVKALKSVLEPLAKARKDAEDNRVLFDLAVAESDAAAIAEVAAAVEMLRRETDRVEMLSLLSGPHDREGCFFSLQVGAGGNDACEWCAMLLRMYRRYFEKSGWRVEEINIQPGEEAGLKSADLRVSGAYAYGYLRGEMGVHRLVRISPFSGKRETSFAAVDVTPDFEEEVEIEIQEKDLKIDTFRASGKGGQHVNKTDSAVRITHLPTGIVVSVQNERSQHRNRDLAMKILKAKLQARAEAERLAASERHNMQKMENAFGSQIRSYVLHPYQLVKDVRTEHEVGNAQAVLDGELESFIIAYLRWAAKNACQA